MSRVVVAVPPQHEVLPAAGDGLPQHEASVGGVDVPRVSAIVPYRARTAARISSWVSVSIPSSPLVVTASKTAILTRWVLSIHRWVMYKGKKNLLTSHPRCAGFTSHTPVLDQALRDLHPGL